MSTPSPKKPILCLDFDGVLHSYKSKWLAADVIPDPPVNGAMRFLWDASQHFKIAIYSSRSSKYAGRLAMRAWIERHFREHWKSDRTQADDILADFVYPRTKPAAFVTIDDRAITFTGIWPEMHVLQNFKPWNKK